MTEQDADPARRPEGGARRGSSANRKGLVIVNTGDGKGKTTAALGVLFRAWGRGMNAEVFQFIKHTGSRFGESRAADKLDIPWSAMGDGFTWLSKDIDASADMAGAQWGEASKAILAGERDLIILDEFTYPLAYGWIDVEGVIEVLKQRPEMMHVIITGRNAPDALIEFADLVTEMREIKHPFNEQGIRAQPGIEF